MEHQYKSIEEKNRLIKQIVREITYLREGDDLYIDIKFL